MRATNTTFIFTMATTVVLLLSVAFIFVGSGFDFDYIIPKRLAKLAAIFIGGSCVATAAITFQTLAGNRILTPSIMGYESIYLVFQALLLLFLGTGGIAILGAVGNFFASIILILLYSLAIQYWVLQKFQRDMYQVLLIGFVLTMVLTTLAQFIQLRISPGEFSVFQGLSYASFDRATLATLLCAAGTLAAIASMAKKCIRELDVVGLGRDQAMSLGLNDANYIPKYFALIAILVAVSISLIGPTAFMGIFVANIAYSLAGTSQHRVTLPIGCAVAIIMFISAQLIVEHLFNYKTTVTILVNILCGGYFLAMTMRARSQL